jgi:hypothetical protein
MMEEVCNKRVWNHEWLDAIFNPVFWSLSQKTKLLEYFHKNANEHPWINNRTKEAVVFRNML